MNKVYKVIWNECLRCFVVVSEFASSKKKCRSSKMKTLAISSLVLAGASFAVPDAYAGQCGPANDPKSKTSLGDNSSASGDCSTAIGNETRASGAGSTALGNGANASGNWGIAIGNLAKVTALQAIAVGRNASATGENSLALGREAQAKQASSVALGENSVADRSNTVSIGRSSAQRQLVNLAAGTQDTDGVNVSQLKGVTQALGGGSGVNSDGSSNSLLTH